jgi:hypothetical protein
LKTSERKIFLLRKGLDFIHCKRTRVLTDCQVTIAYWWRKYAKRKAKKLAALEKKRAKAALLASKKKKSKKAKKAKKKPASELPEGVNESERPDSSEKPIVVDEEEDMELEPDAEQEATERNFESMREHDIEITVQGEQS